VAQFTRLDPALVARIAARYGLTAGAATPLAAGTINSNYRIDTDRGRMFLRVNEGAALADVAWEAALVAVLADRGVPTPRPLATLDGASYAAMEGLLLTLFPWVDATHHDPPAPADCAAVGRALRRFHDAGADFPDPRMSRYAQARIVERADRLAATAPARLADVVSDVRRELDALASSCPPVDGIIHGDLFPDNVLFAGADAILLDFEQASAGSFVYDLAVVLLSWCWADGTFVPERVAALITGYRSGYGLVDTAALYDACRFGAVRFTVTRLTDVELDPRVAPEMRALKDYREFWARLKALRALSASGLLRLTR
jgi:homoserine kinase type II